MADKALDIRIGVDLAIPDISIGVNRNWKTVEFEIEKGGSYYPAYEGPYEVDASFYYATTLATYKRTMENDVTVNRIPVYEASNPQGGKTVTIGEW